MRSQPYFAKTKSLYKPWLIYVPVRRRGLAEICIPLAPMAARHGFRLIEARVDRVDVDAQHIHLAGGQTVEYSQLVVATGSEVDRDRIPGAGEHASAAASIPNAVRRVIAAKSVRPFRETRSTRCSGQPWRRRCIYPGLGRRLLAGLMTFYCRELVIEAGERSPDLRSAGEPTAFQAKTPASTRR